VSGCPLLLCDGGCSDTLGQNRVYPWVPCKLLSGIVNMWLCMYIKTICYVYGCQGALSCFAIEGALTVTLFHLSICDLFMFMGVRVPSLALQ
jgi:hypothetical protein